MEKKVSMLRRILEESRYTVAICGSGMMEEAGIVAMKDQSRAYDIEKNIKIHRKKFLQVHIIMHVRKNFLNFIRMNFCRGFLN